MPFYNTRGVMQEDITSADVHYACYVMAQGWTISTHVHSIACRDWLYSVFLFYFNGWSDTAL